MKTKNMRNRMGCRIYFPGIKLRISCWNIGRLTFVLFSLSCSFSSSSNIKNEAVRNLDEQNTQETKDENEGVEIISEGRRRENYNTKYGAVRIWATYRIPSNNETKEKLIDRRLVFKSHIIFPMSYFDKRKERTGSLEKINADNK